MFFPEGQLRVYLYGQPADLRRSFNGLQVLVRQGLREDPTTGSMYVFINRRGSQIRILYFDRSGFCIWSKKLEAGRLISDWRHARHQSMDWTALKLLLEGIEPARRRKRFSRPQRMQNAVHSTMPAVDLSDVTTQQHQTIDTLKQQVDGLKHQIEWFKRQIFGSKSERFVAEADPSQLPLGAVTTSTDAITALPRQTVITHTRRVRTCDPVNDAESLPFFDDSRLPVHTIEVLDPEIAALAPDQYEIIDTKTSYRLAQRPGSYEILKYVRPVVKRKDTQQISCALAPVGVIDGSRADVSFVAGLLVDKFAYHLPLYRQHLRLTDGGVSVSRPWLTQLSQKSIALLEPIYQAQLDAIRDSHVIAIDETPIKAGRNGHGKMKVEYFWPIYGDQDEVCFPFFTSRATEVVHRLLGFTATASAVLLTDGYAVYQRYAKQTGLTHAQCWAHARRTLYEAQSIEPQLVAEALSQIQALYAVEQHIRDHKLAGESKKLHRLAYSKPIVECFFAWIDRQFQRQGLLPSSPFTQALEYVHARRLGLEVFLTDPDVPIDTNHLERALRAIPMGRKNYLTPTGAMVTDMTPRARRLAEYFASIVVDATTNFDDPPWVRCRRRPGHRRCTGLIQSFPAVAENDDEAAPIVWRCPVCGDDGLISGWQNSLWDGFSNPPDAS